MSWKVWSVAFEGKVKSMAGWHRVMLPEVVTVMARDAVEAQQLAFRRASGTTLRPTDISTGALWAYPRVGA